MTCATFKGRLVAAQEDANLSTEALARQVGVGLRVAQRWRSGETEPSGRNLVRIAAALDRHPAWFFTEDDAKTAIPA
jgi:transcriptional regulator with XRE-family HTH domain